MSDITPVVPESKPEQSAECIPRDPAVIMAQREEEYRTMFCVANHKTLKDRGVACTIHKTTVRSMAWKVYLEVLPPYVNYEEWPLRTHEMRCEYAALCKKYIIDPRSLQPEEKAGFFDPLSQTAESPWNQYFRNIELEKDINKDVERTYPEYLFFQLPEIQIALRRVLFIYCKEHPDISYRQGMHELLAPVLTVLWEDATNQSIDTVTQVPQPEKPVTSETGSEVSTLLKYPVITPQSSMPPLASNQDRVKFFFDPNYLEHDAFCMFRAMMNATAEFFTGISNAARNQKKVQKDLFSKEENETVTPVVKRCVRIQNVLLRQKDPQLFEHFTKLQIEPQLYAMRWLKLLFGREFNLRDLMILWDAIFAYGRSFSLVDYISVSMLMFLRSELLQCDQVSAMKRLLRYPPVEDITLFVEKAVELITPKKASVAPPASPPAPSTPSPTLSPPPASPPTTILQAAAPWDPVTRLFSSVAAVASPPRIEEKPETPKVDISALVDENKSLKAQVSSLEAQKQHMVLRIERVIFSLQSELTTRKDLEQIEALVGNLAELKRIHAVMSGALTEDVLQE